MKGSPVGWLLEEVDPSVRYFTFRDILGKSGDDFGIAASKQAISESKIVKRILQKQKEGGYWEEKASPYLPKYKASYWQIMMLGQLGTHRANQKVERACEYILQFQLKEGGFTCCTMETAFREYNWLLKKGKKLPAFEDWASSIVFEQQLSCLTGNMVAALIRLGYEEDDFRVKKALEWLVKIQNVDGGWLCPYWKAHIKDNHGCFHGTICSLEAFSEVKTEHLTKEMKRTIERGAEFLLMHRLFKADHHNYRIINESWLKFGFPWFSGYNILRGLDILTKLGYVNDERLLDAVEVLLKKRQGDGTWILENAPIGRMQVNIEAKGKPSKWITLIALRVLKRLSSAKNKTA